MEELVNTWRTYVTEVETERDECEMLLEAVKQQLATSEAARAFAEERLAHWEAEWKKTDEEFSATKLLSLQDGAAGAIHHDSLQIRQLVSEAFYAKKRNQELEMALDMSRRNRDMLETELRAEHARLSTELTRATQRELALQNRLAEVKASLMAEQGRFSAYKQEMAGLQKQADQRVQRHVAELEAANARLRQQLAAVTKSTLKVEMAAAATGAGTRAGDAVAVGGASTPTLPTSPLPLAPDGLNPRTTASPTNISLMRVVARGAGGGGGSSSPISSSTASPSRHHRARNLKFMPSLLEQPAMEAAAEEEKKRSRLLLKSSTAARQGGNENTLSQQHHTNPAESEGDGDGEEWDWESAVPTPIKAPGSVFSPTGREMLLRPDKDGSGEDSEEDEKNNGGSSGGDSSADENGPARELLRRAYRPQATATSTASEKQVDLVVAVQASHAATVTQLAALNRVLDIGLAGGKVDASAEEIRLDESQVL